MKCECGYHEICQCEPEEDEDYVPYSWMNHDVISDTDDLIDMDDDFWFEDE